MFWAVLCSDLAGRGPLVPPLSAASKLDVRMRSGEEPWQSPKAFCKRVHMGRWNTGCERFFCRTRACAPRLLALLLRHYSGVDNASRMTIACA